MSTCVLCGIGIHPVPGRWGGGGGIAGGPPSSPPSRGSGGAVAAAGVHRPWNVRTSSPPWNSSVAPIPSRRSASFAALIVRVPLNSRRDVNSATPWSEPSAATPAGTLPRNAMNGFDGKACDRRTAPFSRTGRSGRVTPGPPRRGSGAREGQAGDQQRGVEFHLLPHADVGREARVDERAVQAVRTRLPVAGREWHDAPPAAEDRRQEDERRGVLVAGGRDVPARGKEVRGARAGEVAPPPPVLLRLGEAEGVPRRPRLQGPEPLTDVLRTDR